MIDPLRTRLAALIAIAFGVGTTLAGVFTPSPWWVHLLIVPGALWVASGIYAAARTAGWSTLDLPAQRGRERTALVIGLAPFFQFDYVRAPLAHPWRRWTRGYVASFESAPEVDAAATLDEAGWRTSMAARVAVTIWGTVVGTALLRWAGFISGSATSLALAAVVLVVWGALWQVIASRRRRSATS